LIPINTCTRATDYFQIDATIDEPRLLCGGSREDAFDAIQEHSCLCRADAGWQGAYVNYLCRRNRRMTRSFVRCMESTLHGLLSRNKHFFSLARCAQE